MRFSTSANLLNVAPNVDASTPVSIPLVTGWNMIGNPRTTSVAIDTLTLQQGTGPSTPYATALSTGLVGATLYTYQAGDTGYEIVASASGSITPYTGCWLYASQACTLTFPAAN